jgi:hypothetical protein
MDCVVNILIKKIKESVQIIGIDICTVKIIKEHDNGGGKELICSSTYCTDSERTF